MKLPKEYMDSFLARKVIPLDSWNHEIINNKTCNTIKNTVYTHLFWFDLWLHLLSPMFKSQQMIHTIEELDMTRPVIITENLELTSCQPIINNIEYFSTITNSKNPFVVNISIAQTTIIYTILAMVIILMSLFVKNLNILLI